MVPLSSGADARAGASSPHRTGIPPSIGDFRRSFESGGGAARGELRLAAGKTPGAITLLPWSACCVIDGRRRRARARWRWTSTL
jgi:hypothetical protein